MANTSSAGSQGKQRQEQQGARIGFANQSQNVSNTISLRLETTRSKLETTGISGNSEIMANTNEFRTQSQPTNTGKQSEWFDISGIDGKNQEMANTKNERDVWRDWIVGFAQQKHNGTGSEANGCGEWWAVEPNVGRVADGVAARVDRLKAIGNGQVPEVARTAWGLLK
jgi:hypothetical protein